MANLQKLTTKHHREGRRDRGLTRLALQVPAAETAVLRKAAAILREQSVDAARLRTHLGFEPVSDSALSALDVFTMVEPLSAEGESFWDDAMTRVERDRRDDELNRARDPLF
jgi:hypothetical protein